VFDTLAPYLARGVPVVGLEPSCLLTMRDEFATLLPPAEAALLAEKAFLFEEFLVAERAADRIEVRLRPLPYELALVHGHCHQKAFGLMETVAEVVDWVPDLTVETVETGCCGMAGSFGYEAEHYETSMQMAELGLLPAIRAAHEYTLVVADGTSCRRQIADGTGRVAWHTARVLASALRRDR
jgi:Fe-S oxidoreductase